MAQRAQQTFTASPDGVPILVTRGEVFPDAHPLLKLDLDGDGKPRNLLFKQLDVDEPPPEETPAAPVKRGPGRPPKAASEKAAG